MTILFSKAGTPSAPPTDAATVILVRPKDFGGAEVFLLRRHGRSSFMASHYVFPGGRVDDADADPRALARVRGRTAAQAADICGCGGDQALAIHIAAVRETFEEAGVLLASHADTGAPVTFSEPAVAERFRAHRRALWESNTAFADILEREDLVLSLERLHYWGRWITPSLEPKRFDARFFVAELPAGQTPLHDQRETVAELWLDPREAATAAQAGTLKLPPPTLRNLEDLGALAALEAIHAESARRAAAPAVIQPRVHQVDGAIALLLPWDPEYEAGAGEGPVIPAGHPLAVGPSRFVLEGEVWISRHARS